VHDLGSMSLDALAALRCVLVIASTHGDGDPPDAVGAFASQLASAQGTALAGLKYAVLALGDSSYARFCQFGKMIDERFAALGASRLADRVDADGDLAAAFQRFREQLWPALKSELPAGGAIAPEPAAAEPADRYEEAETRWSRERPFAAELLGKPVLNGAQSDKEVRHVVLSLKDSTLTYEPGDALGVWPRQSPDLVQAVLSATGAPASAPVTVDGEPFDLGEALSTKRELTVLTSPTVIKFARPVGRPRAAGSGAARAQRRAAAVPAGQGHRRPAAGLPGRRPGRPAAGGFAAAPEAAPLFDLLEPGRLPGPGAFDDRDGALRQRWPASRRAGFDMVCRSARHRWHRARLCGGPTCDFGCPPIQERRS